MSFKSNYERICFEKHLKPSAVCEAIGLSRSTYSLWTDESVPRRSTLDKLSAYLDVTPDELLSESSPPQHELHIQPPPLSPSEQEIIDLYRISPDFRAAVDSLVRLASPASKNAASSISKEA